MKRMSSLMNATLLTWLVAALSLRYWGCGSSEVKPVDIYPEDMCSHCRMAISDLAFASEIVTSSGEVFKFDDLGCMEAFKEKSPDLEISAMFVKDYDSREWLAIEQSTIVQTDIQTPMGSGKVAFGDSMRAREFAGRSDLTDDSK